jgi:hypothetical protein
VGGGEVAVSVGVAAGVCVAVAVALRVGQGVRVAVAVARRVGVAGRVGVDVPGGVGEDVQVAIGSSVSGASREVLRSRLAPPDRENATNPMVTARTTATGTMIASESRCLPFCPVSRGVFIGLGSGNVVYWGSPDGGVLGLRVFPPTIILHENLGLRQA